MEALIARYLADDLSVEERKAFESKLVQDESLCRMLEAQLNLWEHTNKEPAVPEFDATKAWEAISGQLKGHEGTKVVPIRRNSFTFLKIAATLLILMVAGYFVITGMRSDGLMEVRTGNREMKEVTLPDGTLVKLNANSLLTYEKVFEAGSRKVSLVGEGDFDVTENPEKPFIISTSGSSVEVLGTHFDVSAYPGKAVELNVREGKVLFTPVSKKENGKVVSEGQCGTIQPATEEVVVSNIMDFNFSGWWTKELVYDQTRLEEVLNDLENTYWVNIEYSPKIADCKLTATFDRKPIEEIIEIIEVTFGVKATSTKENHIKLEGKACSH